MGPLKNPPPVRRIVVEDDPTVVEPPKRRNGAAQTVKEAASGLLSAPRKREAKRGKVQERMRTEELGVAYAGKPAVKAVSLSVNQGEVLGLIGPSGCGKTTLLRSLNRLVDQTPTATRSGTIYLDDDDVDLHRRHRAARRQVGMVFQQPNPFPMSVFDNVAYGLRERGSRRPVACGTAAGGRGGPRPRRAARGGQGQSHPPGAPSLRRTAAAALHREVTGRRA